MLKQLMRGGRVKMYSILTIKYVCHNNQNHKHIVSQIGLESAVNLLCQRKKRGFKPKYFKNHNKKAMLSEGVE